MRSRARFTFALLTTAAAAASVALAQYALDANLSSTSRVNARRTTRTLSKPVYTMNQSSGTFIYNRANAFNDSSYSIHQRYTHDRFENFTPAGTSTSAAVVAGRPRNINAVPSGMPAYKPAVRSRPHVSATAGRVSSGSRRVSPGAASSGRVSRSAWDTPAHAIVLGGDAASYGAPAAGHALGSRPRPVVGTSELPPLPEDPVVRPMGYSVTTDSFWPWR